MDRKLRQLVAMTAMLAPSLHTGSDALEWIAGGFSPAQLWLNYLAFLPVPAMMVGLFAVQRPRLCWVGLFGAVTYGWAFIYFAHTTLFALAARVPTYDALWRQLGSLYTIHGGLMVLGGLTFGWATLRGGALPAWTAGLFLAGVCTNLMLALLPGPDLLQTLGSGLRNAGLASMGWTLWRT